MWNNAISMIEASYVNYCILLGPLFLKLLFNREKYICKSEQAIDIINLVVYTFIVFVLQFLIFLKLKRSEVKDLLEYNSKT